jgi:signal transduction histidine kinase
LTLQLDATFDKASSLLTLTDPKVIDINQYALRADLRGLVILMGQMPDSDTRLQLARVVRDTRNLLFSPEKIVSEVTAKAAKQTNLNTLLTGQNEPIALISALSAQLNDGAKSRVFTANTDLSRATQSLVLTVSLTAFASLITIIVASFYIVERQINRRMARLTTAVLSIADGDTDYAVDVDVDGPDELGKISKALEVFKLNAKELSRSNTELEKFAYAAAHDLRSPLRAIQDLIEWTMEDRDNNFSADGEQNMALLQNRIERLNRLLSDLLEYSRVGQEETDITELSLGAVVQEMGDFLDPDGR